MLISNLKPLAYDVSLGNYQTNQGCEKNLHLCKTMQFVRVIILNPQKQTRKNTIFDCSRDSLDLNHVEEV